MKQIYLVDELLKAPLNNSEVQKALSKKYGLSYKSFHNDWSLFTSSKKADRTSKERYENIKEAIKLMKTIDHPNTKYAIEVAKEELNEAELNN